MGEYADDYFRREVMSKHGFDPGSMYGDDKPRAQKKACPKCGKHLKSDQGVKDHMRDYHDMEKMPNGKASGARSVPLDAPVGRKEETQ